MTSCHIYHLYSLYKPSYLYGGPQGERDKTRHEKRVLSLRSQALRTGQLSYSMRKAGRQYDRGSTRHKGGLVYVSTTF